MGPDDEAGSWAPEEEPQLEAAPWDSAATRPAGVGAGAAPSRKPPPSSGYYGVYPVSASGPAGRYRIEVSLKLPPPPPGTPAQPQRVTVQGWRSAADAAFMRDLALLWAHLQRGGELAEPELAGLALNNQPEFYLGLGQLMDRLASCTHKELVEDLKADARASQAEGEGGSSSGGGEAGWGEEELGEAGMTPAGSGGWEGGGSGGGGEMDGGAAPEAVGGREGRAAGSDAAGEVWVCEEEAEEEEEEEGGWGGPPPCKRPKQQQPAAAGEFGVAGVQARNPHSSRVYSPGSADDIAEVRHLLTNRFGRSRPRLDLLGDGTLEKVVEEKNATSPGGWTLRVPEYILQLLCGAGTTQAIAVAAGGGQGTEPKEWSVGFIGRNSTNSKIKIPADASRVLGIRVGSLLRLKHMGMREGVALLSIEVVPPAQAQQAQRAGADGQQEQPPMRPVSTSAQAQQAPQGGGGAAAPAPGKGPVDPDTMILQVRDVLQGAQLDPLKSMDFIKHWLQWGPELREAVHWALMQAWGRGDKGQLKSLVDSTLFAAQA